MSRAPRSKSTVSKSSLLTALEFCSCVSEKLGAPYETHIGLRGNWAIAFNGIVAAGSPIAEDIIAYPHNLMLIEALSNVTKISHLPNSTTVDFQSSLESLKLLCRALIQS